MAIRPYSATLQQAFRDTLGTPGAPEVIDDGQSVIPVAVVAQVNTSSTASFIRITDGTDNLAVNTDLSLPVRNLPLPEGATWVNYTSTGVATGTAIRTVTAGKTFLCLGVVVFGNAAASTWRIDVAGTPVLNGGVSATNDEAAIVGTPVFVATSGQAITAQNVSAANVTMNLWGYEF